MEIDKSKYPDQQFNWSLTPIKLLRQDNEHNRQTNSGTGQPAQNRTLVKKSAI
jgi:hypothetical protein